MKNIFDPTRLTFALAGIGIVLLGFFRPESPFRAGVEENQFWFNKLHWKSEFDGVLAGDSRVYRGLSPAQMQKVLPEYRIANFGFSGLGFENQYFDAMESILDFNSSLKKFIILGLTPLSLTPKASAENGFLSEKNNLQRDRFEEYIMERFPSLLGAFRPIAIADIKVFFWKPATTGYFSHWHKDGWVASDQIPPNTSIALNEYRKNLGGINLVSQEIVDNLMKRVRKWVGQSIRVFAFYPSPSPDLRAFELSESGYNKNEIIDSLRKAGAIWLELDAKKFETYDGSHATSKSAEQMSSEIAKLVKSSLDQEAFAKFEN